MSTEDWIVLALTVIALISLVDMIDSLERSCKKQFTKRGKK
jgi:hypothetical protein